MDNLFQIKGKIAVVTGAARGLGFVYAKSMLEQGATVIICDLNKENVDEAISALKHVNENVYGYQVNITSEDEVKAFAANIDQDVGQADILVNNAGVVQRVKFEEMDEKEWNRVMDVNVKGTFLCIRYIGFKMKERGQGKIVNIASIAGRRGLPTRLAYCTSKASIEHVTRVLAMEWGSHGVNVNAIGPGFIKTKMNEDLRSDKAMYTNMVSEIPMGRFGEPEELIGTLLYLVSPASNYVTGQTIFVDGGILTM